MSDVNETREGQNDVAQNSEETLASPGVDRDTRPLEENPKKEDHPQLGTQQESDQEQTIHQNTIAQTLREFSETLEQDLLQTLPQTRLRPKNSQITVDLQSVSLRARDIQPTPEVSTKSSESKSTDDADYLTMRMLGQGGMGTVHLARQVALGREVALKQIQSKYNQKQSVKDEFLTEAVLTGKLEHPNIVPIYEVAKSASGDLFYSMKNIKGQAWNDSIDTLSLDENLDILIDVCDAIAFAHAEGVIHRDLKPQNIMTGGFGEVLVLDWGLAVLTGPDGDVTASAAGTPSYMAPEMVNPPFTVGPRSDIYLLGAILFKILTGTPPHGGKSAFSCLEQASKNQIATPDEERVGTLDPSGELLGVALRSMETQPQDRFQSVPEFQQAIRDFLSHRESLELSSRAQSSLESAESSSDYTHYSRAVFGFEEALKLWDGNSVAADGVAAERLAWALCAENQSDFDLSLSLLDETTTGYQEIRARVTSARDERDARQHKIRRLRRFSMSASLAVAIVASVAAVWINVERNHALRLSRKKQFSVESLKNRAEPQSMRRLWLSRVRKRRAHRPAWPSTHSAP
jgi:hypothetical protein